MNLIMEKAINHFCHEHPLFLTKQYDRETLDCYVCGDLVANLESAYVCEQPQCNSIRSSSSRVILHKRCGELPLRILSHPLHPKHPIHLFDYRHLPGFTCNPCDDTIGSKVGYRCPSCEFDIHIECSKLGLLKEREEMQHPSHIHPLTLMRKNALPVSCDGCGTQDVDMAYICSTCEYSVHVTCASLPIALPLDRHQHHHELSLAFCFPMEHRKYRYKCDVCDKDFDMTCWLYYCGDCRYFAHLKCVASTTDTTKQHLLSIDQKDCSEMVQFPLADISSKLITPFVMREKGIIPDVNDMPRTVKMPETARTYPYLFNYHNHPLSLVSKDDDDHVVNDHEEGEDDDDDEDELMKICEVCVTPISSPPYYQCAACKYFIHSICYLLPKTLSSSSSSTTPYGECQKSDDKNHKFALHTSSEGENVIRYFYICGVCRYPTNGMVYRCEECEMIIVVKCASLPTAIKHASHSHPNLIMTRLPENQGDKWRISRCCGDYFKGEIGYRCNNKGCDFALHLKCVVLPPTVRKHEWDHHPLLLTFDASPDHPSDFFCEFCEEEMHPKIWMYHCRQCDQSYHTPCLETASGWYRNAKFGRRFELDRIHPHPLTYNYITLKKRCDICHLYIYTCHGLECVSCYFVVCLFCGDKVLASKT